MTPVAESNGGRLAGCSPPNSRGEIDPERDRLQQSTIAKIAKRLKEAAA
jgi:hypothetical protein